MWQLKICWIWYVSTSSSQNIFWIQKIFCLRIRWLFYVGMPAYDASVICQDPNLFLPEADSKDPVVPICHHRKPAIGYLANCTTSSTKQQPLAMANDIYGDGIGFSSHQVSDLETHLSMVRLDTTSLLGRQIVNFGSIVSQKRLLTPKYIHNSSALEYTCS